MVEEETKDICAPRSYFSMKNVPSSDPQIFSHASNGGQLPSNHPSSHSRSPSFPPVPQAPVNQGKIISGPVFNGTLANPLVYPPSSIPIFSCMHPSSVTLISASQPSSYSPRPGILKPPSSQIPPSQPGAAKSFAQALGSHLIPYSSPSTQHSFPAPFKDHEGVHIRIPSSPYQESLADLKFCLVGRFIGKRPSVEWMQANAKLYWKVEHSVALLNSHYLFFRFKSEQDLSLVLSGSPWKIEPFSINLSRWYQSFKPDLDDPAIKPVRFPLLSELWRSEIFFAIARGIGNPLKIDDITERRSKLLYARICVDIDLRLQRSKSLLI